MQRYAITFFWIRITSLNSFQILLPIHELNQIFVFLTHLSFLVLSLLHHPVSEFGSFFAFPMDLWET